ncbi:hypothetical protein Ahy_B06g080391 [Arachis hypogaea]|uniref:Uncharacterized protein n=1 Tax=Arachis hypogaea TaxID=3818 RepID=A0A444YHU8_ARAHY|nr:hypothetical protein Ahy_B06g080391 [Arachis hypogaea]
MSGATLLACNFVLNTLGRRLNEWYCSKNHINRYYDFKLGDKHRLLPPGGLRWPLLGNTWHYFKHPHLFMDNLLSKSYFLLILSYFNIVTSSYIMHTLNFNVHKKKNLQLVFNQFILKKLMTIGVFGIHLGD